MQCQTTAHFDFCANFSKNGYERCLMPEKCCINLLFLAENLLIRTQVLIPVCYWVMLI